MAKRTENDREYRKMNRAERKEIFKESVDLFFSDRTMKRWTVDLLVFFVLLHTGLIIFRYIWCFVRLDRFIISNNTLYIIIACVFPFVVWVYSTTIEYYNFRNRKLWLLSACIINAFLTIAQPAYTLIWKTLIMRIMQIQINEAMTQGMVVNLARIVEIIPLGCTIGYILYHIFKVMYSEEGKEKIGAFKLGAILDLRENADGKYDLGIVKDLDTGEVIHIFEIDRFTAILLNGVSGTGKTSSAILAIILNDLNNKIRNRRKREKSLEAMVRGDRAYLTKYSDTFTVDLVQPNIDEVPIENESDSEAPAQPTKKSRVKGKKISQAKLNEQEYLNILKIYQDIGITVMAPNNAFIEDVLRLAKARKIKCNIIDPEKDWSKSYDNAVTKRMNPFYVPLGLSEDDRVVQIFNKATVFAEVLVALNEAEGPTDVYFRDINTSVTSNIATIVMLYNNLRGTQASIKEIQHCIIDFNKIAPMVQYVEEHYQIKVSEAQTGKKKGSGRDLESVLNRLSLNQDGTGVSLNQPQVAVDDGTASANPFYETLIFIKQELLGEGAAKMYDQARGLRNLINKFLTDPRVKDALMATDEDLLDFDEILANCEITLVNTANSFSKSISTAFGLFFQLNFRTAVMRRPKEYRPPHTLIIDECAQYMHPFFDDVVALYRQYGIMAVLALQTLSQTDKSANTRYLKDVFMGCGTHIVYGRIGVAEMQLYSEMGGIQFADDIQHTVTGNSLLAENSQYSESDRTTRTKNNVIEGGSMRYRDFQEVTIFTLREGKVLLPKIGKVSFVAKKEFRKRRVDFVSWQHYMPEKESPVIVDAQKDKETLERIVEVREDLKARSIAIVEDTTPKQLGDEEHDLEISQMFNELMDEWFGIGGSDEDEEE